MKICVATKTFVGTTVAACYLELSGRFIHHGLGHDPLALKISQLPQHRHPLLAPSSAMAVKLTAKHPALDFIGDIHGCGDELETLLQKLGYEITWEDNDFERVPHISTNNERKLVLLGDLVDRGPRVVDTLQIAATIVANKLGYVVLGNHDLRLMRFLSGKVVERRSGIDASIAQLSNEKKAVIGKLMSFLQELPSSIRFEHENLHISHTGMDALQIHTELSEQHLHAVRGKLVKSKIPYANFDDSTQTGEEFLLEPPRHWTNLYTGSAAVIYGHYQVKDANWVGNSICLDTGCVYGGKLSALRWPENEIETVQSLRTYHPDRGSSRPLPSGQEAFQTPK